MPARYNGRFKRRACPWILASHLRTEVHQPFNQFFLHQPFNQFFLQIRDVRGLTRYTWRREPRRRRCSIAPAYHGLLHFSRVFRGPDCRVCLFHGVGLWQGELSGHSALARLQIMLLRSKHAAGSRNISAYLCRVQFSIGISRPICRN